MTGEGQGGGGCGGQEIIQNRRNHRKNPTDAEKFLWKHLRSKQFEGLKFRRQEPVGRYIADFICHDRKIVIEVDGGQHAEDPGDRERDDWFKAQGYSVVRFWNNEVLGNIEGVLEKIREICSPSP
ncbi:MAG: endonuclease domain-containing protein [Thermodesulfobacteriota bacterium]